VTYSRVFQRQPWVRFHVKDGENGPRVWEVKHAPFYPKRPDGLHRRPILRGGQTGIPQLPVAEKAENSGGAGAKPPMPRVPDTVQFWLKSPK